MARRLYRFLASLPLAVTLLIALATTLAGATLVEMRYGAAVAQWYVYGSRGFLGLLALLAVNIFCAAAIRFPWSRRQTGFVVTHASLLILLAGAAQSFLGGVEGEVSLVEGAATRQLTLPRVGQLNVFWVGRPDEAPYEFRFALPPVDHESLGLELGQIDGIGARCLALVQHPRSVEEWGPDETGVGGPVVHYRVRDAQQRQVAEGWLADQRYGDAALVGPLRIQMERAASDRMLDDFRAFERPLGERGVLAMYFGGESRHLELDQLPADRVEFHDGEVRVEVVDYLPNAIPDRLGRFVTKGEQPKNPMVEMRVHVRGSDEPIRQIAFAKDPLLNLDGVYGRDCPVKFRYVHPAVVPAAACEMLQTSDGKLHGRLVGESSPRYLGELSAGQRHALPGGFQLEIIEYLPRAKRELRFVPNPSPPNSLSPAPAPAAQFELLVGEFRATIWLQRSSDAQGRQTLDTPRGPLAIEFVPATEPLGFELTLLDFQLDTNPGNQGHASLASRVTVTPENSETAVESTIRLNEPLVYQGLRLYLAKFAPAGHSKERVDFRVARDPGRPTKYVGCLGICLGIALMFALRAPPRSPPRRDRSDARPNPPSDLDRVSESSEPPATTQSPARATTSSTAPQPLVAPRRRRALLWLFAMALASSTSAAVAEDDVAFDWDRWRTVPVLNGGRVKPLESLARESLRSLANRGRQLDPDSGHSIAPLPWFLVQMLEWRGWEHPDRHQLQLVTDWRALYFHLHEPDRWDRAPLLRLDDRPLATALGAADETHIAPYALAQRRLVDRRTERELEFSNWADAARTARESGETLTDLEQRGLELAERLWAYQHLRMGRTLEVLPQPDDAERRWASLAVVLLSEFDDANDPAGDYRRIQSHWQTMTRSWRAGQAADFNAASADLVALLEQLGQTHPDYPTAFRLRFESAYYQIAPFRWGWMLMLLSAFALSSRRGRDNSWVAALGHASYGLGLLAFVGGLAARILIAGRPPVTNMYESVVYVGGSVALLGCALHGFDRRRVALPIAAWVATLALLVADSAPLVLDDSVRPLEPVLRSAFWLTTHVLTITLSYAALALGAGCANATLIAIVLRPNESAAHQDLGRLAYRCVQIGVVLLSAGIALGGVWADYAWGRFWGWDPKEVWALVALLGYVALLHARFAGWVGTLGFAAMNTICFALVIMAWYGVNFVLGSGLHSYGFGGGGQVYVYAAAIVQFLFTGAVVLRADAESAE